ncbi:MMPL family transporter [Embleya scabrispora]|uniref:MMPL family transporter n=1 Tax=Embleya scabrispora TaxID=159449 RepID=UPI0003606B2B|nr:MMPL family transporter [Embleya scabrispora]MYS82931.1 MMPL family transporter [Streptomyces sp. SID5474]
METLSKEEAVPAPRRGRLWAVPWAVVGGWILVVLVAGMFAARLGDVQRNEAVDYLPANAESTRVAKVQAGLPGGDAMDVQLVYHRDGGLTAADRELAAGQVAEVSGRHPLVAGPPPVAQESVDHATLRYALSIDRRGAEPDDIVPDIREVLDRHPDGLTVRLGGPGGITADMQEVFGSIDGTLMLAGVLVVAVLLMLTYRSPYLWIVPLACAGVAVAVASAAVYGLVKAFGITVTGQSSGVLTVLVFGAGTDYALLLVARYREELRVHARPLHAMVAALRGCGPAVVASSGTVVVGLLCLTAADLNSSRGMGPVGAVGVVCALAVMTTLLPAVLVLLGRRVFWPFVPAFGSEPKRGRGAYARIGAGVSRRPIAVLVAGVVLLWACALTAFALPGPLRQSDGFTAKPESIAAQEMLSTAFPEQSGAPISVLARTDRAAAVLAAVSATEGVDHARQARTAGGWTEILAFAKDRPESNGEHATIERLRAVPDTRVGGPSAQQMDTSHTTARDRRVVVPLVLLAVLLVLIVLLRSLVAPLILVVAVVLVWAASLGVGGLIFEHGFGYAGVDAQTPLLTFVFLVALGVDYGIFLMHRVREMALRGDSVRIAAPAALETTGGVIASAGFVLAATFSVLMLLPLVSLVELGFVVAVGVLIDTFLVRTFLVTAASVALDRRIWWPGPLSRRPVPDPAGTRPAEPSAPSRKMAV